MKRLSLRLLTLVACLHGLAWTSVEHRQESRHLPTNGYEMIAAFSPEMAKSVPESFAQAPIEDLKVSKNKLFFRINGYPMFVEWIGQPGRLMKFNNRLFIEKDFASEEAYRKAFFAKFSVRQSALAFFMPRGFASIDDGLFGDSTAATNNNSEEESAESTNTRPRSGFIFEGLRYEEGFNAYLNSPQLFANNALLGQTQAGRDFEARVGLTTGDSLMAMVKYAALFQGSIAYAMNPAAGFTPGFGLTENLGASPSSVPLPHRSMRN